MGFSAFGQRQAERLLGSGLAYRTGDANDARLRAGARCPGEIAQAVEHIRHHEQGRILGKAVAFGGGDDRKPGPRLDRSWDEVVAVAVVALDGEECLAGSNAAGIDRNPRHADR
jgi:hypothetical protein